MADELRAQALAWPSYDRWSIGIQLTRAADSVGANIAEALGRWHKADQARLLYIARGSLAEVEHWVLVASARGLLEIELYQGRIDGINRSLNALLRIRRSR